MRKYPKKYSISYYVFIGTLIMTILVSLVLSMFLFFSRHTLLRQAKDNNTVYAQLLSNQLDHSLQELQKYIENIYFVDRDFRRLVAENRSSERYLLSQDIMVKANNYLSLYPFGMMFYITAPGLKSPVVSTLPDSSDALAFSDYINAIRNSDNQHIDLYTTGGLYMPVMIGDQYYLHLCYERNKVHIGVFVDLNSLMETIQYADDVGHEKLSLRNMNGDVLGEEITNHPFHTRTLSSESSLTSGPILLVVETPAQAFMQKLNLFQLFLFIMTIIAVIVFSLCIRYQQSKIYKPLQDLRNTLQRINQGNYDTRLDPENQTWELSEIYQTINTYIDKVTELRTQTYEERLNRQNIEMQFLQLQLRPHFFLNAMKGIYALAENKECAEIQEYVLCLSKHFQFLLYDTTKRIELKKELMHTQNYMQMQRIGLHKPDIFCDFRMNGVNENTLVPPLILQTFMENSIKYAIIPGQALRMETQVTEAVMDHNQTMLNFSFRDNGPGFSEDILSEMKKDEESFYQHHKGFGNLKRRLNLIYSAESSIYAFNYPNGGAAIDILIPKDIPSDARKSESV